MLLVIGLQALEDLDGIVDRRLVDVDLLEAPDQRTILLEVAAVFLVGGRTHAAQAARLQRRLQPVRGVHGAARRRPRPDPRVALAHDPPRPPGLLELYHEPR